MKEIQGANHKDYEIMFIEQGDIDGVNIGGILAIPKSELTTNKLLTLFQFDKYQRDLKDINTGEIRKVDTLEDAAQRIAVDDNISEIIDRLELNGQIFLLPMLPNAERIKETLKEGEKICSMDSLQREGFTNINDQNPYYRIDEQVKKMIEYVIQKYDLDGKTNIFGHSAMGLPAMRFAMIQPQIIDNLIIGGNADEVPTPFGKNGENLKYPFGIKDFEELFEKKFDMDAFSQIAFRHYIGEYEYVDPNLDGIRDDNYGTRRDGRRGTGNGFAPADIAEEYKQTYNANYKSDYNLSVYERLQHVLEQYELAGLDMKYKIYPQDCHTPITAKDLRDAQFNDGINFEKNGSKILAKMLEKIKQLEEYAISEGETPAKKKYMQATEKIYYNKEDEDRQKRVEALKELEDEYSKSKIMQEISISKSIATGFAKEPDVVENKETAYEAVSNTEHQLDKEEQRTESEKY